ncbi:cytochrome c [Deinococcus sp. RL]|uniref:c-type cytochrome n=1 Tax=Deinococcus sp. RL TaxID=1489678 RepID=UPI0009E03F63|nr:cytochrome c [Deinococcus sp. RL]
MQFNTALLGIIALATSGLAVKSFLPPASTAQPEWEYTQMKVGAVFTSEWDTKLSTDAYTRQLTDKSSKRYEIDESALTAMGKAGWELVGVVPESETVYPNFGNSGYVTGLQPNIRPASVTLLFKRLVTSSRARNHSPSSDATGAVTPASNTGTTEGFEVYIASCEGCHGPNGTGARGPALTGKGQTWELTQFTAAIRQGTRSDGRTVSSDHQFSEEEISAQDLAALHAYIQKL